mmetsp:Transcript_32682/g.61431  ORF Transcript_32682/g.61431 Transcript_32682/m.61431 type:complete len:138 (+) Transcript_32682:909-1322(+)
MDMKGVWHLKASTPGDMLTLSVAVKHPDYGNFFTALLSLEKQCHVHSTLDEWLWFRPQRVAIWIYWHALVLIYKGVTVYGHPKDLGETRTSYREVAAAKLEEMQGVGTTNTVSSSQREGGTCPVGFVWRDAKSYPWR